MKALKLKLPVSPPFPPMDALSAEEIPRGKQWQYEPKWDGFRCIAFRDGPSLYLQSKAGQPLQRYFPELVAALLALPAKRFVLDGEITAAKKGVMSFDDLLMRIHPAASRILKLSQETPVTYIVFDLLVDGMGKRQTDSPLVERRRLLERFLKENRDSHVRLSPATSEWKEVKRWYTDFGGGLDGVIAKNLSAVYESGERSGVVQKIKNLRSADCVVGGFRYSSKKKKQVGSLLLGLYDEEGLLQHVGFTSSIHDAERAGVTQKLIPLIGSPGFTGQAPGGPSRWSTERSSQWQPLKTRLVVEVQYDHFSGGRFRHGTKLLRWRPDKSPKQCRLAQVQHESQSPISLLG